MNSPNDPLVLNEMGVLLFRGGRIDKAVQCFQLAYDSLTNRLHPSEYTDCIIFNLATTLRKLKEYAKALSLFTLYAQLRPNAPHAHSALGFMYHLMGNVNAAVEHYHASLAIKPDLFCREMLERALHELHGSGVGSTAWCSAGGVGGAHGSPAPTSLSKLSAFSRGAMRSLSLQQQSTSAEPQRNSSPSVGRALNF